MALIWVVIFFCISGLSALLANKKGHSGWMLLLAMNGVALAIDVFMMAAFYDFEHRVLGVTVVILAGGLAVLARTIARPSAMELAVKNGQYGKYKRCPLCAEPVRKEAVKCKHCHSDLPTLA